jgi:arylsulfatase A-like enzyme
MKRRHTNAVALTFVAMIGPVASVGTAQEAQVDRTELPVKGPWYPPHLDKLAGQGLMYNQFHTTALCSPTRQALKTGRNHHAANQAKITEVATFFPGATGMLPADVASIGEMLRLNGYSTAAYGKWHETAVWEISPSGPFARWPNYRGFDEFYGFLGGETNQWAPAVYHKQSRVETPDDPDYSFMNDMATQSIQWMRFQQSLTPDKPFFVYFDGSCEATSRHLERAAAGLSIRGGQVQGVAPR